MDICLVISCCYGDCVLTALSSSSWTHLFTPALFFRIDMLLIVSGYDMYFSIPDDIWHYCGGTTIQAIIMCLPWDCYLQYTNMKVFMISKLQQYSLAGCVKAMQLEWWWTYTQRCRSSWQSRYIRAVQVKWMGHALFSFLTEANILDGYSSQGEVGTCQGLMRWSTKSTHKWLHIV